VYKRQELETEWRRQAELYYSRIRGNTVPADAFDEVMRLVRQYRAMPTVADHRRQNP